jgi:ribonuclease PH
LAKESKDRGRFIMNVFVRNQGREFEALRSWKITRGVLDHAEGSALIETGRTRVLCAASVEDKVPPFLRGQGTGWITAEYAMLPRSTHTRSSRDRGGKIAGRTMEIQRLIGRSLRCVADLTLLGERTVTIDCDVIQADGGTRVAAITGAWVALRDAVAGLMAAAAVCEDPVKDSVAAVSVGIVESRMLLDLDYTEDSVAEVDMNVVMTGRGELVEVQATAERSPFSLNSLNSLICLAQKGLEEIRGIQEAAFR